MRFRKRIKGVSMPADKLVTRREAQRPESREPPQLIPLILYELSPPPHCRGKQGARERESFSSPLPPPQRISAKPQTIYIR